MSKIIFYSNPNNILDCEFKQIGKNQVRLVMESIPDDSILLSGFALVNEHNYKIQTDRKDYVYLYRTYEDGITVELCNNNEVYVKPLHTVTFKTIGGGTFDGLSEQKVGCFEDLVIPTPVNSDNYEFTNWKDEIPTSGEINDDVTFYAIFTYVPTEEESAVLLKNNKMIKIEESKRLLEFYLKENPLLSSCHNNTEAYYTVTSEKQSLMTSNYLAYSLVKETGIKTPVLTWNASGCECEIWTEEEFKQLIVEVNDYIKPFVAKQQSLEIEIKNCNSQGELDSIEISYDL